MTQRTAQQTHPGAKVLAITIGLALAVQFSAAKVKVRVDFDKAFDFGTVHTWTWNPKGAGEVMVARTPTDDPAEIKRRAEPVILKAVAAEMSTRTVKNAAQGGDLTLTYYLLLTIGSSAQTLGQFLPATTTWGLPPYHSSTTSFEMIERGALVLDFSVGDRVIWRGIGEAQIKTDLDEARRAALLTEAATEILKKFPPKP
jgi:hypothetical protein